MPPEEEESGFREIVLLHDEVDGIAKLTEGYLNSVPVDIGGRSYCVVNMRHERAGENVVVIFGIQEMLRDTCEE